MTGPDDRRNETELEVQGQFLRRRPPRLGDSSVIACSAPVSSGGDRDHQGDLHFAVSRKEPGREERRLARQRHAGRLGGDQREQGEVAEMGRD